MGTGCIYGWDMSTDKLPFRVQAYGIMQMVFFSPQNTQNGGLHCRMPNPIQGALVLSRQQSYLLKRADLGRRWGFPNLHFICMYEKGAEGWERPHDTVLLWITLLLAPLPVLSSEHVNAQCGDSPRLLWKEHFHPFHSLLLRKSGMLLPLLCFIHQYCSLPFYLPENCQNLCW